MTSSYTKLTHRKKTDRKQKVRKIKGALLSTLLLGTFFGTQSRAEGLFFKPSNPKPQAPLFVDLHGCLSSPEGHAASSRMNEQAERYGFYVYYPDVPDYDNQKGCFDFYSTKSPYTPESDAGYVMNHIRDYQNQYDIDKNQTFLMGMSGGASMVSLLAACYPDDFNGVAIHSGQAYGLASTWQQGLLVTVAGPQSTIPRKTECDSHLYNGKVFLIHGSRDQVMNPAHYFYLKNDLLSRYENSIEFHAPLTYRYPYLEENFFDQQKHLRGKGIFVLGMNHEWSGGPPTIPVAPRGPDVTPMIVKFFLDQTD